MEGANGIEDRRVAARNLAGGGGAHRPDKAKPVRDPFKRLPMPCRDADSGMDQLMRENGRDLRRHRIGACARSGRMKISKCPSALSRLSQHSPIALPLRALVKPIATRTREGRAFQRLEQRSHARRHPVEPAFAIVLRHAFYSLQIACPAMAMPSAGTRTPKNAGERGGAAGFDGGGAAAAQRYGPV
jgi:hypothetical protein